MVTCNNRYVYLFCHERLGLLPFPTRRSSDLEAAAAPHPPRQHHRGSDPPRETRGVPLVERPPPDRATPDDGLAGGVRPRPRSEEHTSELQSPDHLVCRLLLEKKKKIQFCKL